MNLYKVKFMCWEYVVAKSICEAIEKAERKAKKEKYTFDEVEKIKLIEQNIII